MDSEFLVFLSFIVIGIIIGSLFDFFRIIRRVFKPSDFILKTISEESLNPENIKYSLRDINPLLERFIKHYKIRFKNISDMDAAKAYCKIHGFDSKIEEKK